MIKMLMICHGNICRSTMAEFVFKDMIKKIGREKEFYVESAGTSREELGNDTHYGTKKKLKEMGVPVTERRARQVTPKDYENFDYLVCMDNNNRRNLNRIIGKDYENKVCLLLEFANSTKEIADPWYTGNFDKTYTDIVAGCKGIAEQL